MVSSREFAGLMFIEVTSREFAGLMFIDGE